MPASLSLTFTPFTNPTVMFASKDAANAFFGGITVTITSAALPDATPSATGAVKQATSAAFISPGDYVGVATQAADGSVTTVLAPAQNTFDALKAEVAAIKAALVASGAYAIV